MLGDYINLVLYLTAAIGLFCEQATAELPLSLAKKLSNYKSSSDFLRSNSQTSSLVPDPSADCQPRLTVVELPKHPNPDTIYVPNCVTAMRCGGCCFYSGHSCLPLNVISETHTVEEYKLVGDTFEMVGQVNIQVEAHTLCECDCRVTPSDCNDRIHNFEACQCVCTTENKSCPTEKVWNESTCQCQCPEIVHCFEDEYFNFGTCSCQKLSVGVLPSNVNTNTSTNITSTAVHDGNGAASSNDLCSHVLQCPTGEIAVLGQPRCVCSASHVPRRSRLTSDDVNDDSDAVP